MLENQEVENDLEVELDEVAQKETTEGEVEINLDDELVEDDLLTIEDKEKEVEDEQENNPVRQLRNANRELAKKLKLAQQEQARIQRQLESNAPTLVDELPPEPDLGDDDVEYDPEKFKRKYSEWVSKKAKIEGQKQEAQNKAKQSQELFNQKLVKYEETKRTYKNIDDYEKTVTTTLDQNQQGIIVNYADDPAFMVVALGKNPVALSQLAAISDPILYAIKVREIEKKAKEQMKAKSVPQPETVVKGKTVIATDWQKKLDKMRDEGKVTEAIAYKKQLRAKGIAV